MLNSYNKIIFLDIDNVINLDKDGEISNELYSKYGVRCKYDQNCINILNDIHKEIPDVKLVISSDWKLNFTIDELKDIFKLNGITIPIIGITTDYSYSVLYLESTRIKEIKDKLREFDKDIKWCAIDDMNLGISQYTDIDRKIKISGLKNFVHITSMNGLAGKGFKERVLKYFI